jgi:hypothetical protein
MWTLLLYDANISMIFVMEDMQIGHSLVVWNTFSPHSMQLTECPQLINTQLMRRSTQIYVT